MRRRRRSRPRRAAYILRLHPADRMSMAFAAGRARRRPGGRRCDLGTIYFWTAVAAPGRSGDRHRARCRRCAGASSRISCSTRCATAASTCSRPTTKPERGQQTEFLPAAQRRARAARCKHGSAYQLTPAVVAEFAQCVKFQGARSGLLVTPGTDRTRRRKPARRSNRNRTDRRRRAVAAVASAAAAHR